VNCQSGLPYFVLAGNFPGGRPCRLNGWQQNRNQYAQDDNDDQKFDEREGFALHVFLFQVSRTVRIDEIVRQIISIFKISQG